MIKFFRKIRQQLLTKNSISKYLLYALGEIILVVIGILIALQINNQNEERKETIALNNYLQNISNNIKNDRVQLESMIAFRDSVKKYSAKIMAASKKEYISVEDFLLITQDSYNIFYDLYLEINKSGFEALKSSGYLGKIQNTRIETLLNEYYLNVQSIEKQEKSLNDFIENMEVLGFEQGVFVKVMDIMENPDMQQYFRVNQNEIHYILNHSSIIGANLRGSLVTGLFTSYTELISLGEEIGLEIETLVNS